MNLSKVFSIGWLVMSLLIVPSAVGAHQTVSHPHDAEVVWKSDRLFTSWFGEVHKVRLGRAKIFADWVVVKVGKNWDINIDQITVKYLDPEHPHPVKKRFYPYERLRRGDRVRFKLPEVRQILAIKVVTSGWSGSHAKDAFRIILKRQTPPPTPPGWVQTGYFYGKCIGGSRCPGYRRSHIQQFSIDLKGVRSIKRIQFFSHDNVGSSHNAKVSVYVDDEQVAHRLNIKRRGSQHILDLSRVFGRYITFVASPHDEAVIQRISVDYSDYRGKGHKRHFKRQQRHDRHGDWEHNAPHDRRGHERRNSDRRFPRGPYNQKEWD